MSLEAIESPPYPNEGTTANGLFNYLKLLSKWILFYRDDLNSYTGQEVIPNIIDLPDKNAYITQPIYTQYQHLMLMRNIREQWDSLIRLYEDDWTIKTCIQGRIMLVQAATVLFNSAFTPYEVMEARHQKHIENMHQSFEGLLMLFRKLMTRDKQHEHNESDYD